MKKIIIFGCLLCLFASCGKSDESEDERDKSETVLIKRLYDVKLPSYKGYSTYVLRVDDGRNLYLVRWKLGVDLHEGDKIDIEISPYCTCEIRKVNGVDFERPEETDGAEAKTSRGLIASDPIETDIIDLFSMEFIQAIPLLPIPCYCIEDEHGELLVVSKSKVSAELKVGDRIVYNVYTLYPNDVLMLKKLRD